MDLKLSIALALLLGGWAYILRLLKRIDGGAIDYAACCQKLRESNAVRLALIAQINDFKIRALDAEANARAQQARATEIREIYMKRAGEAARAPIENPMVFLRNEASK